MDGPAPLELDSSVPVVLIWPSIAVMRSLGRLGVRVFCVDPDGTAAATASRYCHETVVWDLRRAQPAQSVAFLGCVAERVGGKPILLAADDLGAIFVAEHRRELARWDRMRQPAAELARALSNKERMFHLCREHGVPTPDALFPKSRAQVEGLLDELEFPILLKGIDTQLQEVRTGKRMVLVGSKDELLARYDELESPDDPNPMLQEYVPGGAESIWMFNGYFDGESRAQIRRRELQPASWFRSFRGIEERQWLARDDPVPFAAMGLRVALSALRRSSTPVGPGGVAMQ